MWGGQRARGAVAAVLDTAAELAVRLLLLSVVFVMEVTLDPYTRHVPFNDLVTKYKRPRRHSIIPVWAVIVIIVVIPIIFISTPKLMANSELDTSQGFLAWSMALSINAVITELTKLIVGRPRPDFFYRCFPDGHITRNLQCTGDSRDVKEGRKSFPSGHSSFAFCSLGFLSLWLCGKLGVLSRSRGKAVNVLGCLLPMLVASAIAMSRCCDHHHHWEDVLVGSLIGFFTSYLSYYQYFHNLDWQQSGEPYATQDDELSDDCDMSRTQCCTKDLDENLCRKSKIKCKAY